MSPRQCTPGLKQTFQIAQDGRPAMIDSIKTFRLIADV